MHRWLIILWMALTAVEATAQFGWVKNKSLGPGRIWDVVQEPDGGLTILGDFIIQNQQPARPGLTCHPDARSSVIWLARLDSNWNIVWEQCYGGSRHEYPRKIIKQNDSTYIVFFSTQSEDGILADNNRSTEIGVMKVNKMGVLDSIRFYGGSAIEGVNSVTPTRDGGFILGCQSNSGDGDVPGHYGPIGGIHKDAWVIKLDSLLDMEWSYWWGGSDHDDNVRVTQWIDGSHAVVASSASSDYDLAGATPNYGDVWLIKLDKSGSQLWQKSITDGPAYDYTYDVLVDSDSNLIMVGKRDNYWCDSASRKANMWVTKVDTAGQILWEGCYGDKYGYDRFIGISENPTGYLVHGTVDNDGGDVGNFYGFSDDWLVQLDKNGSILWEQVVGGTSSDNVIGIINNHTELVGFGNANSNDYDLKGIRDSNDYTSAWLFQLELFPVGVEESDFTERSALKCHPNPATSQLQVEVPFSLSRDYEVAIYDISGRLYWMEQYTSTTSISISTASFPAGLYVITVSSPESGAFASATFSVVKH